MLFAFVLNFPWTLVGLFCSCISSPYKLTIRRVPFCLVVNVKSFWWCEWFYFYKGVRGLTLGNIIILSQRTLDRDLEHEIIHIEQYRRRPFIHPLLYFYESYKRGYVENKYEKEAYQKAKNKYLGKDIQLP